MEISEPNPYMTVQEAARDLEVTDAAIRQAIAKNRLPFVILYGRKLINRADIAAYKQRTRQGGEKPKGRPRRQRAGAFSASDFTALVSEEAISAIWDTPEEDEAWRDL